MNNAVLGKTTNNVTKYKKVKLLTTWRRRNYLVSEPNYHTTKFFTENLLALEVKLSQFWYDYVKPKYGEKVKLCYMDTDNFIDHM